MSKALAKVYREAARRIAEDEEGFCCNAIVRIVANKYGQEAIPQLTAFADLFYVPKEALSTRVNGSWYGSYFLSENQMARSLALLLAAEIVEGDK